MLVLVVGSIQSYRSEAKNVLEPVTIDTREDVAQWGDGKLPEAGYDAVMCVNMIHISEWSSTEVGNVYYLHI